MAKSRKSASDEGAASKDKKQANRTDKPAGGKKPAKRPSPAKQAAALVEACAEGKLDEVRALLDAGADPNQPDTDGDLPLVRGVESGNAALVALLLERGARPGERSGNRALPLPTALERLNVEIARMLLDAGAPVEEVDQFGETPLRRAVFQWRVATAPKDEAIQKMVARHRGLSLEELAAEDASKASVARELLELVLNRGADLNAPGCGGFRPLHEAAEASSAEGLELLVQRGADPNLADNIGGSPIHYAAERPDMLRALLALGADPNHRDNRGETPLMAAAELGALAGAKILLEAGADPNAVDGEGRSVLKVARAEGGVKMVKLLLAAGATDAGGASMKIAANEALCEACEEGDEARALELLKEGADPNAKSATRDLPLWSAADKGMVDVVRALLAAKAKPDPKGTGDSTPLHRAAAAGHAEVVRLLVAAGAKLEALSDMGREPYDAWTPLAWAAQGGDAATVQALIEAGAKVDFASKKGMAPILVAAAGGHMEIVKALAVAGAKLSGPSAEELLDSLAWPERAAAPDFAKAVAEIAKELGREAEPGWREAGYASWLIPSAGKKASAADERAESAEHRRFAMERRDVLLARGYTLATLASLGPGRLALLPTTSPLAPLARFGPLLGDALATLGKARKLAKEFPCRVVGAGWHLALEFERGVDAGTLAKKLFRFGADELGWIDSTGERQLAASSKVLSAEFAKLDRPIAWLWWD